MRWSGQFQACFFFFHEKILSVKKKHQNAKQTIFTLWEAFVHAKNCCSCCFLFAYFCFVSWFLLVTCIFTLKNFSWKKNKQAWNCPGNLIYYTTEVHPYQPGYQEFICMHLFYLWSSARITFFVRMFLNRSYLWEYLLFYNHLSVRIHVFIKKSASVWIPSFKTNLLSSKHDNDIFCWFHSFQVWVFYFEFFSFCVWLFSC